MGGEAQKRFSNLKPKNASEAAVLEHLQHEEALMAAEENIHTYQNLRGGQLLSDVHLLQDTGYDLPELDIAATFEQHGIPVTRDFIERYPGREGQIRKAPVWDLFPGPDGSMLRLKIQRPTDNNQI